GELLPGRVDFGGVVEPAESASWIRGAIAALVSIVPGIGYDFARPTKTYAAAACGTPVIFAGTGAGAAVVRSGDLGEGADFEEEAVSAAMQRALENADFALGPEERTRRAQWARENVSLTAVGDRVAAVVVDA